MQLKRPSKPCAFISAAFAIGVAAFLVQGSRAGPPMADAELKRLSERAAEKAPDLDALRNDIMLFRQSYPGTPQAVRAAGLLRDLPSPADKLNAGAIPALEKFPWHPKELVAILGEHRGRHGNLVSAVAYSRNGKWLVSGGANGLIRCWDPASMRLLHTTGPGYGVVSFTFNKESTLLISGAVNGHAYLWKLDGEKPEANGELKISSTALNGLSLSPSGKTLAAGGADSRLYLWDLTTDPPREITGAAGHTAAINAVAFAPDGRTLATGGADKAIRLWQLEDKQWKEKSSLEGIGSAVHCLSFNPADEKLLASGEADGTLRVWNLAAAKPVQKAMVKTKNGAILSVAYSQSGNSLATGHSDGTAHTWSAAGTPKEKSTLEGHAGAVNGIAFAPDGSTVTTGGADWTVRQWIAVGGPKPRDKTVSRGHLSHSYAAGFSPDGKMLASGSYDTTVRIWDLGNADGKERPKGFKTDGCQIYTLAFSPDGKTLAAGGSAASFRLWDIGTRIPLQHFKGHEGQISSLAFSPDGTHIASCSTDKTARLWNAKTGEGAHLFKDFQSFVNAVAFSPDGKRLGCASGYYLFDKMNRIVYKDTLPVFQDSGVRIYDMESKKELFRWKNDLVLTSSIAFGPDGSRFAAGASDTVLRGWTWPEPKAEPEILAKGAYGGIGALSYSPDGRLLASYGPDARVCIWNAVKGTKRREWTFAEQVGHVAFAPDSRHLAVTLGTGVVLVLRLEVDPNFQDPVSPKKS